MSVKAAAKSHFVCQHCGYTSPKWLGKCPECGSWNTLIEEARRAHAHASAARPGQEPPKLLSEFDVREAARVRTGLKEFDRVLGGGLVPGSLILVGGDPGIGKSTLLLQAAFRLAATGHPVLYVSGEESGHQIKLRADRLGPAPPGLFLLCETRVQAIQEAAERLKPAVVIADSIQTLTSDEVDSIPGSVSQVRECGNHLLGLAKQKGPAVFLVGHVTKEGTLAGPRVLEHLVDTVLYFEGDRQHGFRILRTVKNRFGSTNEVGLFEMGNEGLTEVGNPSAFFLAERQTAPGSAVTVCLEGTRPLLIEVQALVTTSYFGMPQRRVSGLDYNRSCLMLAVLERRGGISLGSQDVFLSVAGGLQVDEPAVDLAVIAAVASSVRERALDPQTVVFGEVGLGGEVRAVGQAERRLAEAAQLGFQRCLLPQSNLDQLKNAGPLERIGVRTVSDLLERILTK